MKVLVVDDDDSQARALARALSRRRPDLTVVTSPNGVEAIQAIKTEGVDAVLTDLRMPEMDGFELLAWLANNEPAIPAFAMSAYGDAEARSKLSDLGAIECFSKPVDIKALLTRLSDALSQAVQGHVRNVSLASFLQLMEMERKTCSLTVRCNDKTGELYLNQGQLVDAKNGDLAGEAAAVEIIGWPNPTIAISSERNTRPRMIETSLGFIVMEAMRVQDEATRNKTDLPSEYPPAGALRASVAAPRTSVAPPREEEAPQLPAGASALAVIDTATGIVTCGNRLAEFALEETARAAAELLRAELDALARSGKPGELEEVVLSTRSRCDMIRPLDGEGRTFALLIYSPEETNLVMARIELDRFLAARRAAQRTP